VRRDQVPAGYRAITCRRCTDTLAVPDDMPTVDVKALCAEHHVWLCPRPTALARLMRHRAATTRQPPPPP
jgi:hypothetical protein